MFIIPSWIHRAKKSGLFGKDINKSYDTNVAEVGGIPVLTGFIAGILMYVALRTFYFSDASFSLELMALVACILIAAIVGFVDDVLGWKIGLRQREKPILTLLAALPIMVVNAGHSIIYLPFLGNVDFGLVYPLVFVPIAIIGASNAYNMLAGLNGLEAGMGMIILTALGLKAFMTDQGWVAMICLVMLFALLPFYFFNHFPAKIFPGDTLTYALGALIACVAIFGNLERMALILFIPYFIEFILKARTKFKGQSYGIPQKNGNLLSPSRISSLTHVALIFTKKERSAVYLLYLFEIALAGLVLLI